MLSWGVRGWVPLIAFGAAACSGRVEVALPPAWPSTAQVAILVLDPEGRPVGDGPRLSEGGAITIEIQEPAGHELLAYVWDEQFRPDTLSPLADCGLVYMPQKAPLPDPERQWRTGPIYDSSLQTLALQPSTRQLIPIYTERCNDSPNDPCLGIDVDTYAVAPNFDDLRVLTMTSSVEAYAAGPGADTGFVPFQVARFQDRRAEVVSTPEALGNPEGLVWDGGDVFYGVAGPGERRDTQLFAFDRQGQARPVAPLILGEGRREVAAGADGSVFVGGSNGLFELIKGSTVAVPILGLPPPIARLAAVSREELYVTDDQREIWRYDGRDWFREWSPDVLSTARVLELSARGDLAIGVGVIGTLLRRDPITRTWSQLPQPEEGRGYNFSQVAAMAEGHFAAAFEAGGMVIWNGRSWCEHPETRAGTALIVDIAASRDGRRAYALTKPKPLIGAELKVIELSDP